MALGKQFVSKILPEPINKSTVKHVKGVFTHQRNYKIACRFYYHYTILGLKYERTLTVLNSEFDLSETRIAQLIMDSGEVLKELKDANSDKKSLQKKFPYYNWY